MPRPLTIRKPCRAEIDDLNTLLEQELTAGQRRRAEVLVLYAAGVEGQDIARTLDIHVNTVYADLKAFAHEGLACVHHRLQGGAPIRIQEAQRTEILRLAQTEFGKLFWPISALSFGPPDQGKTSLSVLLRTVNLPLKSGFAAGQRALETIAISARFNDMGPIREPVQQRFA